MQNAQLTKKAPIVEDSGALCRFTPTAHIPCTSEAVVRLPAAQTRTLINAHMNSHHNRLTLKVSEALFSFLCAPRCPVCAVFVPHNATRISNGTVLNQEVSHSSACTTQLRRNPLRLFGSTSYFCSLLSICYHTS